MKTHRFLAAALLGGLVMLAAGCGKKMEEVAPAEKKPTAATNLVPIIVPAAGTNAALKAAAADGTASNEVARAQSLVEGAKKAFAEGRLQDALTKLTQLSNLELTNLPPDQASAFYEQMEQLEKAAREAVTKPLMK